MVYDLWGKKIMPNYEYLCDDCMYLFERIVDMDKRNEPQECEDCGGVARKCMRTPPGVRTEKTSRTFLDGQRNDGYSEEIKAAGLDAEAMNHNPKSVKYKELKAEAATRRLYNNPRVERGNKYNLKTEKKETKKTEKK